MVFETMPYANFHDLNMDWIIKTIKEFLTEKDEIYDNIHTERDEAVTQIETVKTDELADMQSQAKIIARDVLASLPDDYTALAHNAIKAETLIAGAYTTGTGIETIDSPVANTLYRLQLTTKPDWFPADYPVSGAVMYLIDISYTFSGTDTVYRYVFDENFDLRYKMFKQPFGQWSAWQSFQPLAISSLKIGDLIVGAPTGTVLEDKNNIPANTIFRAQLTSQPSWIPADIPMENQIRYVTRISYPFGAYTADTVIIYDETMNKLGFNMRQPGADWGVWYYYGIHGLTIKVPVAQKEMTLTQALAQAHFWGNVRVELEPGDYVISNFEGLGHLLGKNMHIVGTSGTRIIAINAGSSQYYSVFYAGAGDFILENIEIRGKNIRYCVHDDPSSENAAVPAYHIYRNCRFYIDNTENSFWPNEQCIGGGMGMNSTILVDSCVFESAAPDQNGLLSYHNNAKAGAKGRIYIRDSVFLGNNGTFRVSWYGASTEITDVYASGNSLGKAPIVSAETADAQNVNVALTEWNDIYRTATEILVQDAETTFSANQSYAPFSIPAGYTPVAVFNRDWDFASVHIESFALQGALSYIFTSDSITKATTVRIRKVFVKTP